MERSPASIAKIIGPSPAGIYPRKRLFRLLNQARRRPIVWISAPGGSGKTTLITSWTTPDQ